LTTSAATPATLPELRAAVRVDPDNAGALDALGAALTERGEYQRALVFLRGASKRSPRNAEYLHHLASALLGCGKEEEAVWWLERAVQLDPVRLESWQLLGATYLDRLSRPEDAFRAYRHALQLAPHDILIYQSAARCRLNGRDPQAAIARMCELLPSADALQIRRGTGRALIETGRYEEAVAMFHDILVEFSNDAESLRALAQLSTGMHDMQAASQYFERALSADGNDREILSAYLMHWTRLGDMERARHFYHTRRICELPLNVFGAHPGARYWEGQDIRGKTLRLFSGDLYFGDAFQFVRFAQVAKQAGAKVIVLGPKPIRTLLRTVPGVDLVVARHDPAPPFEYYSAFFWLLFALQVPVEEMMGRAPYLHAAPDLRMDWRNRIRRKPGFNIGIVWHGSAYHRWNRYACRSMPLEQLRPLAAIPGVTLYSLQCGPGRTELTMADPPFPAIDLAPDFPNTAALIEELDLVVTIDTSIAHLAGALGKLTYVMLPYEACFRWMLDRDDTPWYENMRLFRQTEPGHWPDVVAGVGEAVRRLALEKLSDDGHELAGQRPDDGSLTVPSRERQAKGSL
jgi:cytochrome c-type biogenesis protein CcmH/NrfG